MRELVYLSHRKLSQFQPERRRGGIFRRITGASAKAPLTLGELSVTFESSNARSIPHLDEVLKELDTRRRGVQWYGSEDVRAGDWMQFEALLTYAVVGEDQDLDAGDRPLLFWEPVPPPEEFGRQLPPPGSTGPHLLLHASPDGLVGRLSPGDEQDNLSEPDGIVRALRHLRHADDSGNAEALAGADWIYGIGEIVRYLDFHFPSFMASWLAGYARVTGIIPARDELRADYILASPLYVERVSEPEND